MGALQTTTIKPDAENLWDPLMFFKDNSALITAILGSALGEKRGIKWFLTLKVKMSKSNNEGERVIAEPIFHSTNFTTTADFDLIVQLAKAFSILNGDLVRKSLLQGQI